MRDFLPNGVLGVAVTGLLASFMAGMAANVAGFNTVFTYDIWQEYIKKDRPDELLPADRPLVTVVGVVIGIGTAFIAAGYSNIMNYIQALFSLFNAPLFATFIIGMFWKRMTAWAGFWGLLTGTLGGVHPLRRLQVVGLFTFGSDLERVVLGRRASPSSTVAIVAVVVTLLTTPKTDEELRGLVYGIGRHDLGRRASPATAPGTARRPARRRSRSSWPSPSTCRSCRRGRQME